MTFDQKKQNYIQGLLETNAFLIKSIDETPFTLRSGKQSYLFLDHSRLAASAKAYRSFIDVMAALMQDVYGEEPITLCNVDSKISAQMVGSLAYILNMPQIIYKSETLTKIEKGTNNSLTGDYAWAGPIAIIDDVASGGDGTAKGVGDMVNKKFPQANQPHLFVGFVREIKPSTYKTHHIITRTELLQYVWDNLTEGQKQAVEKETK